MRIINFLNASGVASDFTPNDLGIVGSIELHKPELGEMSVNNILDLYEELLKSPSLSEKAKNRLNKEKNILIEKLN